MKNKIKNFFADFKTFITKGRILELAIGVIIGGAFGKIVTSFVSDILMPPISLALGGVAVDELKWILKHATDTTAEVAVMYGRFLQTVIDFLIIAFFIFLSLRFVMSASKNFARLERGGTVLEKADKKAIKARCKADNKTRAEIKIALAEAEAEKTAAKKAEADALAAEEKAKQPPTTEELLTQIRDILEKKKN